MSKFLLKYIFYPAIFAMSISLIIGKFVSLFFFPELSSLISKGLLLLSVIVISRLLWKNIRLAFAEVIHRAKGGLQTVPPLRRNELVERRTLYSVFLVALSVLLVAVIIGGTFWTGVYASKHSVLSLLPFQQTQQKTACTATQSPMPTVHNDIPNPTMEDVDSSGQPRIWKTGGTGYTDAQFSFRSGYQSKHALSITINNYRDGQDGTAMWIYPPQSAVAGETYQFSDWYQSNTTTSLILMYLLDGKTHYQVIDPDIPATRRGWEHYSNSFDIPSYGDTVPVSVIHALGSAGTLTIDDVLFHPQMNGFVRPLISVTFDDGWRSQYSYGLPLLCKHQVPGTFYIVSSYLNNYADYMLPDQVRTLISDGMEIGDHTYDHEDLIKIAPDRVYWELHQSKLDLGSRFRLQIKDFASPYGDTNNEVIRQVRTMYQSHRGADVGLNDPVDFDPYNIMCVTFDTSMSLADIEQWIDRAIKTNTWLVLAFHQVDTSGGDYSIAPRELDQMLAYIAAHPAIKPMTLDQALMEIYKQV